MRTMKLPDAFTLGLAIWILGVLALAFAVPDFIGGQGPAPLSMLAGWGALPLAMGLFLGGAAIAFADRQAWTVRWRAICGAQLLFLVSLAAVHLLLGAPRPLEAALLGRGGGLIGWAIARLLVDLSGMFGATFLVSLWAVAGLWLLWSGLPGEWTDRAVVGGRAASAQVFRLLTTSGQRVGRLLVPLGHAASRVLLAVGQAMGRLLLTLLREMRPASTPPPLEVAEAVDDATTGHVRRRQPRKTDEAASQPVPEPGTPARAGRSARRRVRADSLPPLDALKLESSAHGGGTDARQRAQTLKQTLAEFGVPVEVVSIKEGPTVTQFGLEPGEIVRELRNGDVIRRRVSVATIMRLSNDLALTLAAASIRIDAPVPGRPYVGIEVPNAEKTLVSLRGILESREFGRTHSPLAVALGRDVSGDAVIADLTRMPHLLIAGATGSGKSVCINAIICSLLMNNGIETVRFLMIDPKMVELPGYNGIPHLLAPVITDPGEAAAALSWLTLQMDDRYRMFSANGVRNIEEYNSKVAKGRGSEAKAPLPYLVLVIDELADLMMTAADDIERQICRLAQMARATGIHLVLATQRPSVDVITGLIKANFPARIAFAVSSQTDSRVILDSPGAEKLLGRGDMLFMAPDTSKLARIQGCFVADDEIERVVSFWKGSRGTDEAEPQTIPWAGLLEQAEQHDVLLERALEIVRSKRQVSTSLLQRQLRLGHPRAARLMEQLEEMGAVGPDEGGGRSRTVLIEVREAGADQT